MLPHERLLLNRKRIRASIWGVTAALPVHLTKAGVNPDDQEWLMDVDSTGVSSVVVSTICRVKDLTARRVFGEN